MSLLQTALQKTSDPSTVERQIKDRVREVVRAYRHSWDLYSELLQNSVDAINRRYRIYNDPDFYLYPPFRQRFPEIRSESGYRGRIEIEVDVPEATVVIRDNGVGIPHQQVEEFLLPEGSDKRLGREYGFKGYGLTYAAFISDELHIVSKPFYPTDEEPHEFSLVGLFDWLSDEQGTIAFPDSPMPSVRPATDHDAEWNTSIKIKLAPDYSERFPAISAADQAIKLVESERRLKGFESILRTRTAIGNTRTLFSAAPIVPIDVTLSVVFGDGASVQGAPIPYSYYHPKDHQEVATVAYDFSNYVDQLQRVSFNPDFRGLYHKVIDERVGVSRPIPCDFALSAISSTRLSNVEADLGLDGVETGDVGISYGVHLAINGMPTGLRIDNWDSKGAFLKRYFVVVDADLDISNQLDPGRKGISQYFARLISDRALHLLSTVAVGTSDPFASYASRRLDHGRGREEGALPPQDFQNKVAQARDASTTGGEQDEILEGLRRRSSLIYPPKDEQEVIALFFELLSQKTIKGYRAVYVSGSAVYDAAFEYSIACAPENVVPLDPLGIGPVLAQSVRAKGDPRYVHRDHRAIDTRSPELCVDFKKSVGDFLSEAVQRPGPSQKDPRVLDLLIVWSTDIPPSIPSTSYALDAVAENRRVFHGTTHRLSLIGQYHTEIYCIALNDVLQKIVG